MPSACDDDIMMVLHSILSISGNARMKTAMPPSQFLICYGARDQGT